ncbi:uncharacterized protein LOC106872683 [Octopus bimaculoides]|nr:uncharacterized protein LOC106872683 [Octopus bimaculoides]
MFFYRCSMNTASTLFSILLTCLYILVIIADLSFLASQRCDWRKGDCLRDESVMNVMCERNCSRTPPGCLFRVDRFGIGLKYQCHCFDIGDCDFDNDGYCNGTKCFFGHSGPTCQRRLYYESFETAVKNYESFLGQRKVWRPRNEHLRTRRATCQSLPKKIDFPHVFRINWVKFNIFPAVTIPVYITSSMGNQPLSCTFNPNSPNRVDESSYTAVSCTGDINTNWLHINGSNM